PVGALHDGENEGADSPGQENRTQHVRERRVGLSALAQYAARRDEADKADQEIDIEDRAPALPVDKYPAERGTGGGGDGARGTPECSRRRAALERKLRQDQGTRRGNGHRAPECLNDACCDQHLDRVRGAAGNGRAHEEQKAAEEESAASEAVCEPPCGDERRRKDDRIRVQDPGELREGAVGERVPKV